MTHLVTWYRAVTMQAERVLDTNRDHVDRQIDGYQFVHVLRQALRAACMLRDHLTGPAQAVAQAAVSRFEVAAPDAKNARDVLDHFDDYARGTGNLSHPGVPAKRRQPTEQAARQFNVFYELGANGRYILHLGSLSIDVVGAQQACSDLVDGLLEAVGLPIADDDEAALADLGPLDAANPMTTALAFLMVLWNPPLTEEGVRVLRSLVTEESRQAWRDFAEVGHTLGGFTFTTRPARPSDDVAHVKLVPDTGQTRQVQGHIMITDAWWLTLQRRLDRGDRWLVHALAKYPFTRDELPWSMSVE
ncbi:hypothetical protein [Actinosynnema sp. NPDC023587]|uniref:hypothetical protein n=1 Tax=Actinosynnema sp. NPDC023587 TaxID=3154695 RepID=UPI0033F6EC19